MPLTYVDTPNRGKAPIVIDEETVMEFVDALPQVPFGKGVRNDETFKSQSSATNYGNKVVEAVVKATTDENGNSPFLSANTDDKGNRLVMIGLTVRPLADEDGRMILDENQKPQYTVALRNWKR